MKKATALVWGVGAMALLAAGGANAREANLSTADKAFMMSAYETGNAEVKLGQLAIDKGQTPAVKDFGRKMVDDHTAANASLKQIADAQGITLPTEMSAEDKATYDRLSQLSGADFDKAYLDDQVKDHAKVLASFQKEAARVKNPALKGWVNQTLPVLQQHEDIAKRDQKMM